MKTPEEKQRNLDARSQRYRDRNKEKIAARNRKYYAENSEIIKFKEKLKRCGLYGTETRVK